MVADEGLDDAHALIRGSSGAGTSTAPSRMDARKKRGAGAVRCAVSVAARAMGERTSDPGLADAG